MNSQLSRKSSIARVARNIDTDISTRLPNSKNAVFVIDPVPSTMKGEQ